MFEGYLDLRFLDEPVEGKWFKVLAPFKYYAKSGIIYVIPAGVYTDFASIPRWCRWMISRVGRHGKAAVLHDYLCARKIVPRKVADDVFLEAMGVLKVMFIKRRVMHWGVRAYSILTWKK